MQISIIFISMNQKHQINGIYNYPQQFWIYIIVMTILLSLPICMLYAKNPIVVLLIVASYVVVNLISCILSPCNIKKLGFLTWLMGGIAYLLDLWIIDLFNSIGLEPYAFVVSQIYFIPIGAVVSALICLTGGFLLKYSINNDSKKIL